MEGNPLGLIFTECSVHDSQACGQQSSTVCIIPLLEIFTAVMKVLEDANHYGHPLPRALTYWRLATNYATKATVCTFYAYNSNSSPRKKLLYSYQRQALGGGIQALGSIMVGC